MPTFATATNPIDITAALLTNSRLFGSILPAIAGDPGADLLYVALPVAGESYDVPAFARAAGGYAREGRPIAVATPQDNVAAHFRAAGVPTFASQTRALDSLGQLALHARLMRRKPAQASTVPSIALPIGESRFLSEAESLGLLAACGLPTVPHRVCRSEAEALEAYRALGSGRVVLKGCSAEVPHKSDHGLVVLAVNSEADVALSYRRIAGTCAALGVKSDGVIVARMVDGVRELALGARIDPVFGPAVMLGDGGRYVEILGDVALLLPPFTEDDVHDALATLRIAPVLRGVRGEPPADVAPFCAAAVRLGEIIMGGRAEIASIDLNPGHHRSARRRRHDRRCADRTRRHAARRQSGGHVIAIEIRGHGKPEVLAAVERPRPSIGPGDVLIKVAAAGINRPDVMQRQGWYPRRPARPTFPGSKWRERWRRLATRPDPGAPATRSARSSGAAATPSTAARRRRSACRSPKGWTSIHAAAVPETTFTVWTNMFERGRVVRGETVLIHGGSSGIGTTAIQLGRAFGARVFATAGSAEKCAACEELGAERAFNYRETDFVAAVRQATGGRGVDFVLDIVGGDYLQRNLEVLAMEGRLVMIGQLGGAKSQINTTPIFQKRLTMTASTLRARSIDEKAAIARAVHEHVWPLLESGVVRVPVHATFPLRDAAKAHQLMEDSGHIGKIVLRALTLLPEISADGRRAQGPACDVIPSTSFT